MTQHTAHPTPPGPPPPPPGPPGTGPGQERPLSRLALWALVIGVLSLCVGPLGVAAIVLGVIAITRTSGPDGHGGLGLAIAGTVLGVVGTLGTCLMAGILLPAIGAARQTALTIATEQRLGDLHAMVLNYHQANGAMPDPADWQAQVAQAVNRDPDDPIFLSLRDDGDGLHFVFVPVSEPFDGDEIMFYEDPDHQTRDGRVIVIYDDGRTGRVTIEELERDMAERGHTIQR